MPKSVRQSKIVKSNVRNFVRWCWVVLIDAEDVQLANSQERRQKKVSYATAKAKVR